MRVKGYVAIILLAAVMALTVAGCKCKCPEPAPAAPQSFMMTQIESVDIKAPVEKVFNLLSDPNNVVKYDKNFTISNIQGQGLGCSFHYVYTTEQLKGEGDIITVGFVPNQSMAFILSDSQIFYLVFLANPDGTSKLSMARQITLIPPDATDETKQALIKGENDWLKGYLNGIKTEAEK